MMDSFLRHLYDTVRDKEDEFRKRWAFLSQRTAKVMKERNPEGYVYLDRGSAKLLCDWVLGQRAIDNVPNLARLRKGLDETMTQS